MVFLTVLDASLREKLTKIVGSEFTKITPEIKPTADVAAEAAGSYAFQVPVQVESTVTPHEEKVKSLVVLCVELWLFFVLCLCNGACWNLLARCCITYLPQLIWWHAHLMTSI